MKQWEQEAEKQPYFCKASEAPLPCIALLVGILPAYYTIDNMPLVLFKRPHHNDIIGMDVLGNEHVIVEEAEVYVQMTALEGMLIAMRSKMVYQRGDKNR